MKILTHSSESVGPETDVNETSWQQQMKSAIRDLATLKKTLKLPEDLAAAEAEASFSVFAPLPFVGRIEPGNLRDPLLLQLLPSHFEDTSPSHFSVDPLEESDATLGPGVLKKYAGRALFIVTGACAIHCRYCFRRHFPYQSNSMLGSGWDEAIDAIAADDSIEEVIFSGGDPLTVVDPRIEELVGRLEKIPHLRRLRIHTRLPIMIPDRVTAGLVEMLQRTSLEVVVVIHANHAHEIDDDVATALKKLKSTGAMLLNHVLPYYLHQLDQVVGTSHFEVPVSRGLEIIETMRASLPGFAVPRYVQEIPGQPNKTVLA